MRDLQIFSISCSAGRVAQSVEQRIENPRVDSSILSPATKFRKDALADFAKYALVDFFNSHQICTYRINSQ